MPCVTNSAVFLFRSQMARSSLPISSRVWASSDPKGSSNSRISVDAYAPAGRLDQAGDGQQQTAFSAATWTNDRDEGSARDVEVYIGNRDECSFRLGFLIIDSQALDLYVRDRLYDGASVH